jgi:hypothetical protein
MKLHSEHKYTAHLAKIVKIRISFNEISALKFYIKCFLQTDDQHSVTNSSLSGDKKGGKCIERAYTDGFC